MFETSYTYATKAGFTGFNNSQGIRTNAETTQNTNKNLAKSKAK